MYAFVVVLLLLANSGQPKPYTGSEKSSVDKRPTQQKTPNKNENPSQTIFAVQEIQPENKQPHPYDASNDPLYRAYLIFTIIGVCGGIIGLVLLYKQFVATALSAEAAKESAEAAHRNADVLIEGQRPQLTVTIRTEVVKEVEAGSKPYMRLDVVNKGLSAAYKCTYETWCDILPNCFRDPAGFVGFTDAANHVKHTDPMTIYPNNPGPLVTHIGLGRHVTEAELEGLRRAKLMLSFRIKFQYVDAFGKSRYQNFGLYAQSHGMGFLPKYNDSN